MINFETLRFKFDMKQVEVDKLLNRVENLSHVNCDMQEKIMEKEMVTSKCQNELHALKTKLSILRRSLRSKGSGGGSLAAQIISHDKSSGSEIDDTSPKRSPDPLTPESPSDADCTGNADNTMNNLQYQNETLVSLQDEMVEDERPTVSTFYPKVDEEDVFEGKATAFATQYRFDSNDDGLDLDYEDVV